MGIHSFLLSAVTRGVCGTVLQPDQKEKREKELAEHFERNSDEIVDFLPVVISSQFSVTVLLFSDMPRSLHGNKLKRNSGLVLARISFICCCSPTRFGLFFSLNSAPLNYSEQSGLRPWRGRRTMLCSRAVSTPPCNRRSGRLHSGILSPYLFSYPFQFEQFIFLFTYPFFYHQLKSLCDNCCL